MYKLCKDIVKNLECWVCGDTLEKKKGGIYWVIKCKNKKCKAHVILVTQDELDKLEDEETK